MPGDRTTKNSNPSLSGDPFILLELKKINDKIDDLKESIVSELKLEISALNEKIVLGDENKTLQETNQNQELKNSKRLLTV